MSKIKKYSLMCIISIIILILSISTCVYANDIAVYLGENRDGWFCVQMNTDPANGGITNQETYTYTSNSESQFERSIAYLLKSAKESEQNPGLPDNDFRIGKYPKEWGPAHGFSGFQPIAGKHQVCLWKLIGENSENGTASAPFNVKDKYGIMINNINIGGIKYDDFGYESAEVEKIYNAAKNAPKKGLGEDIDIQTNGLKMNAETDIGSLKITKLVGSVQNIKIYWADGTNEQISTNTSSTNFQIYSNKECTQTKDLSLIQEGNIIYVKNNKNSDIVNMEIEVGQKNEDEVGYKVTFELYDNIGQNAIHVVAVDELKKNKIQGIDVSYGKLTVKKEDYDYNIPLNNAQFAIYYKGSKDSGWIGYNEATRQITYGKTWNEKYIFETGKDFGNGKGYCGDTKVDGEFTIRKLRDGTYTVFEIGTPNGYDLNGQPGYINLKDYGADSNYAVLNGYDSYSRGYTSVKVGSSDYSFSQNQNEISYSGDYGWNSNNSYTSDKLIYTVKNKKSTKLVINKKDKNTNLSIKNVGIKILVQTLEKTQYKDASYAAGSWLWLKQDKTLTSNLNEAYEFKTDNNGKIELSNVPYGKYYIYETTPGEGYVLSEQEGYNQSKPSTGIGNFFNSLSEYVYLGTKTINKQEYSPEIQDGIYMISSKLNNELVLDVTGGSLKSLTSIQTYTLNNSLPQMFMIKYVGNGYYTIRSLYADKYFDVANGIIGPGARIWQYDKNETDAQLWRFSKNSDDSYCITSKLDNRYCLDIPGGENKSGLPMQMYLRNNSDAQKFDLIRQEDQESQMNVKEGNYEIDLNYTPGNRMFAVDVQNGEEDKAYIWLHQSNGSPAQKFTITYIGKGYYIIRNIHSKKVIMTETENSADGTKIVQDFLWLKKVREDYNSQSGYKWKFFNDDNKLGYYRIVSKLNEGKVLDVLNGKTAVDELNKAIEKNGGKETPGGIDIQLYENNDTIAQQFLLESIDSEKTTNNGEPEATIEATNTRATGSITIRKFDGTYKKDLQVNDDLPLKGAEFKIYSSTKQKWVKKENNGQISYSNYTGSSAFSIENSGQIKIENLDYGTYYIFETKSPAGYNLKEQEGYHKSQSGSNDIPSGEDWVALGNCTLESNNKNIVLDKSNSRYVSLSGKVWIDRPDTKDNNNNYDNVYKNGSNDILLQGVTVNLIDNRTNKVIATTNASGTNENGEYKFTQKTDGSKLTYWELAYCYVEFTYDDRAYTLATPFVGSDVEINSKSQIEEVKTDDLRDENLTGNGKAITYKGPTSGLFLNNIQTNASSDVSQRLLTGFYNTSNYTIENINLGLIEKVNTEYSIHEEIEYVKIVRGNYTFTYKYGDEAVIDEQSEETQTAIAFQTSSKKYTQKIYPSDIKYNFAKESDDPKYQVYVLYKISVINNTTHNLIDIYKEDALHLSTLTNQFDDSIYKLNTDELEHEAENNPRNEEIKKINSEIKRWSSDSNSTTANYNINNSNFEKGIAPNAIESTYIQFEVTENGLTNLIKSKSKDAPTVASADGYHGYIRKDKNWKNNDEYKHWTGTQHVKAGGLSIIWKLADERRISGTVFEDTKVNQLEGEEENTRENERIGNGHFEEDNEKTVSDIIVTLMDADKNQVAKLYNGELTEENGKWKAIRHDAVTKVDKEGTYSLPGMIPGRYYLKFTYGNGKIEYTDLNGNKIEEIKTKINGESNPINSNLYKSTILTGNAKKASENEKSWFIDDIGKNNSVATDKTEIITKRKQESNKNVELNYSTSQQNAIIDAESPIMDVQFEYVKNPEIAHNEAGKLNSNCTGMSFGIIERPHINIELTKTIKNVKLTLQNGTTIINGNPEDKNVASNLSKIDDANVKLELDVSYLYGSTAEVTYSLSAQNKSELDYPTEQYYKYGLIEGSEPVKTKVTKVVDYISNSNVGYDKQSNNVEIINLDSIDENMYFSEEAINGNKAYKRSILEMKDDDWLMPEAADPEHSSTGEYTLTVNNLLSTSDGILGWENYSEIIGISNITLTPQYICHSGNYIARDKATSEADNADATISIYSSTGENKNLIIYFMVGTGLLVTLVGIFIIKKFVI